ncbi:hypothetical protein P154DRAFT_528344 [Amniculicola lignicola CBS 123094]|uniref:Uncharacterized protein n=1 Tax=Amniculicola lignicola CBS 123094 TaxID=1392246 RepID=A0A6A5X430_9PLEO|nr:hypothetical protein P154DRAFT_528344 [Amniculicola lignicola CBS 123094]
MGRVTASTVLHCFEAKELFLQVFAQANASAFAIVILCERVDYYQTELRSLLLHRLLPKFPLYTQPPELQQQRLHPWYIAESVVHTGHTYESLASSQGDLSGFELPLHLLPPPPPPGSGSTSKRRRSLSLEAFGSHHDAKKIRTNAEALMEENRVLKAEIARLNEVVRKLASTLGRMIRKQ